MVCFLLIVLIKFMVNEPSLDYNHCFVACVFFYLLISHVQTQYLTSK